MIKLIASDMDGTFLNNNHEVSKENMQAVEFAKNNNIQFVIATGRADYEAFRPMQDANLKCNLICFNGAITYNENGDLINIITLPEKDAIFITNILKALNINYQLYTKNTVYTTDISVDIQTYVDLIESHGAKANREKIMAEAYERKARGHLTEVENVDLYFNEENNPTIKIVALSNNRETLEKAKQLLRENKEISVTSSGENNIEIMNRNATKGNALKNFAISKNISLEETVALGDNMNDYSMLEVVKYSVAMKNGNSELKKIAKYISEKTNAEAGVGHMIKKLIKEHNEV